MSTATAAPLTLHWTADPPLGLYVHVPFCARRCHYCDFNTYEGQETLFDPYVDALVKEISEQPTEDRPVGTAFFGGGTPTLLPPQRLAELLRALQARYTFSGEAEITIEANPETLDGSVCEALVGAGFNRISMGVQSTAPSVLGGLGRNHDAATALAAIRSAKSAGFTSVNADLIYGSPWESDAQWRASLDDVIDADPDHISAYALTIEEGTPLATLVGTSRVPDVDPDVQADRYEVACDVLQAAGYVRYEISNWAKPGHECRHNLVYWCAGDYLAFGAGAHGHTAGERWWRTRLPRDYIACVTSGATTVDGSERLDSDARAGEALMLGLRLTGGIDVEGFEDRFGTEALATRRECIAALIARGLLVEEGSALRLSPAGTFVANEVLARVL